MAQANAPPALMAVTPAPAPSPVGVTAVLLLALVLSPSWPLVPMPQHRAVPSERRAHEKLVPAVTCVALVMPVTWTPVSDSFAV